MVFRENFVWRFSSVYFQDKLLQNFQAPTMTVAGTVSRLRFFPFRTFSTRRRITPSRLLPIIISNPTPFFLSSLSSPSSTLQFPMVRHRSSAILNSLTASNSTSLDWTPPSRGPCILKSVFCDYPEDDSVNQHKAVMMDITGFEFTTEQALFHHYIRTLASVVGRSYWTSEENNDYKDVIEWAWTRGSGLNLSEEEAKRKIYYVSCEDCFGFTAEIDQETSDKLIGQPGISSVFDDVGHEYMKDFLGDKATIRFNPVNWNHRVDDILSYHHLSECSLAWNSNHWLVHIQSLDGEFSTKKQVIRFCIRVLADVVGSEVEAMKKIYSVWCKMPFGFGAEFDKETLNKIKALPGVLLVLPDFAFDVKRKEEVLIISPSSDLKSDSVYYNHQTSQVLSHEDYEERLEESLGKSVQSLACLTLTNDHQRLDNVFSYYHLSERNSEWNYDHWLIVINQHDGGFSMGTQTLDFIIKILAEAIGSEQEAKEKIYIIWSSFPIGFGAEIDEETSNKLKGHPSVLKVLPDYSFDVKDKVSGALSIWHSQKSCFEYEIRLHMGILCRESTCIQLPPLMPLDSNC